MAETNKSKQKRLNKDDKKFIMENCRKLTDAQLSVELGVSENSIYRARHRMGLQKRRGKIDVSSIPDTSNLPVAPRDDVGGLQKNIRDYTEDEWDKQLLKSPRGRKARSILGDDEWDIFKEEWIKFHYQFEDLTHTEESTIEHLIFLRIRIYNNQKLMSQYLRNKEELGDPNLATLDLDNEEEAQTLAKVTAINNAIIDANREYKELLEKSNSLYKSLNSTREQRESRGKITSQTFWHLCESLKDARTREKEGRLAELLKIATEKKMQSMREGIEFADGEVSPQLLDCTTVELMEKQNAAATEDRVSRPTLGEGSTVDEELPGLEEKPEGD